MHRATSAAFMLVLVALSGCAGSSLALGPGAPQGIEGQVLLGPMCPVQQVGNPCPDQPYQAWIDVRDSGGGLVTRVQSDTAGHFKVGLVPGTYILHPESGNPLPRASDQQVEVVAGAYTSVTISFDTGIR